MSERKAREFWFEERINSDSLDWFVHNINQRGIVPNESMIRVREVLPNELSEIERLKVENEKLRRQRNDFDRGGMQKIIEIDRLKAALSVAKSAIKSCVGFEPFNSLEPRILSEALQNIERIEKDE